jgi:hypothetical protein
MSLKQGVMELQKRFQGSLVGAVLGDCIGAYFEGASEAVAIEDINKLLKRLTSKNVGESGYVYDAIMEK